MKISTFGVNIQPGKYKYHCQHFDKLVEKFQPQKVTPFTVEFVEEDFDKTDAVVLAAARKLDLVFLDLEKIEKRLERSKDDKEKTVLAKLQGFLEQEKFLCDREFNLEEQELIKQLQFVSFKPAVIVEDINDLNQVVEKVFEKAKLFIFFTAGKKEVHAWGVNQGDTVLTAAGKIHSDLARGFIKAEIINVSDLDQFHNFQEARVRGFARLVDRDYLMQKGDIIDVKFNV